VHVRSLSQAQTEDKIAKKEQRDAKSEEKILSVLANAMSPMTKRMITEQGGLRQDKSFDNVLLALKDNGKIADAKWRANNGQEYDAYRLA
jgi:hypothetical protein